MQQLPASTWPSANDFASKYEEIECFWNEKVKILTFDRGDGVKIRAAIAEPHYFHTTIAVIPGRGETAHKYAEFLYCTYKTGIKVAVLFARGQGIADRLLKDHQKCHIIDFSDETKDIDYMINKLNLNNFGLLAFSLGGLLALDLIFSTKKLPLKVALITPFLWPHTKLAPWLLKSLAGILGSLPFIKDSFTPYGKEYKQVPFKDNYHSHCQIRYNAYHNYYKKHPELTIGSPTWGFVHQALKKQQSLFRMTSELPVRVLIQTAQFDKVVSTKATERFFSLHSSDHKQPIVLSLPSAYHDVLNESDEIRNTALNRALNFLL